MIPQDVIDLLKLVSEHHRGCEDGWYACPMSEDYISRDDEEEESRCDCWSDPAKKLLEKYHA